MPKGTFRGVSQDDLNILRETALNRIANGDITATSGSGKSTSITYGMTPQEVLSEIMFAERLANGSGLPQRVVQVTGKRGY
jgi:hypothetical protein